MTRYEKNKEIKKMVDKFDWFIVPSANPDGYEYSMTVVIAFFFDELSGLHLKLIGSQTLG